MDRSPDSPRAGALGSGSREALRRIDEEHRQMGELLAVLLSTTDLARVEPLLGDLRGLLVEHFAGEEGPAGMHEIVGEGAAHRLPNVQRLIQEHADILVRLDALTAEVAACAAGPLARALAGVADLVAMLRRHEAEEEEIFSEAFYVDLGGHT
jgi:hypothetical protein